MNSVKVKVPPIGFGALHVVSKNSVGWLKREEIGVGHTIKVLNQNAVGWTIECGTSMID